MPRPNGAGCRRDYILQVARDNPTEVRYRSRCVDCQVTGQGNILLQKPFTGDNDVLRAADIQRAVDCQEGQCPKFNQGLLK